MEYVLTIIGLPNYSWQRALKALGAFGAHLHDHFIPHARNNYHPHILGHRSLALLSGLLVTMKIFTLTFLSLGPVMPAFSSAITPQNIISLTNESRKEYQLNALVENSLLAKAAQAKADDMLAKGYFSHNTPNGDTPWSFIVGAGYNYIMAGENLAVNFTESEAVEEAWMNSPGHKANILNKNFEEIGIGISQGQYQGHTAIFVVQMFGVPAEQKIQLSETPTQVQTAAVPPPAAPQKVASATAVAPVVQDQAPADSAAVVPVRVESAQASLSGETVNVTAQTTGPAVKVLAYFGSEAIMLSPKNDGTWQGQAALGDLAEKNAQVRVLATGMLQQSDEYKLAEFAGSTQANFNLFGSVPKQSANMWGQNINLKTFEHEFYLFFVAGLLTCQILAIAVKRHVQHLPLIANSSFVIIFATLMWWTA